MEDGIDLVALSGDMNQTHAKVTGDVEIGFILLQALQNSDIALEGCIMCCCISLNIFAIQQFSSMVLHFR